MVSEKPPFSHHGRTTSEQISKDQLFYVSAVNKVEVFNFENYFPDNGCRIERYALTIQDLVVNREKSNMLYLSRNEGS